MKNSKISSKEVAHIAAQTLSNANSSDIAKSLAASVLSQRNDDRQTGKELETKASKVLKSPKFNETTKMLAGSVMSQANKKR